LRTLGVDQKGNSGTPFLQINNLCRERGFKFNYNVFGIQKIANDYDLFKKAAELSVTYVVADEIINKGIAAMNIFQKIIKDAEKIYLSICLDVFNAAFAPGVSAPTAQGLSPWHLNSLIDEIRKSGKLISFDIVEFNPNYDRDTQTAKLAASYVSRILFGY